MIPNLPSQGRKAKFKAKSNNLKIQKNLPKYKYFTTCSEDYWSWALAVNQGKLIPKVGTLDSESSAPNPREFNPQNQKKLLR